MALYTKPTNVHQYSSNIFLFIPLQIQLLFKPFLWLRSPCLGPLDKMKGDLKLHLGLPVSNQQCVSGPHASTMIFMKEKCLLLYFKWPEK